MPALTGIISKHPHDALEKDLDRMIESLRYEDFYRTGRYVNRELGLYAGWTAHADAFSDGMPLVSPKDDAVIIFQGENYLDSEASARLGKRAASIEENNAQYLLSLYEAAGEDFLNCLNGFFCGLLVEPRKKKVTLFNDRYGMSRLYFHESPDELIFSSEAKSLLKVRPALRALEPQSVAEFLKYNCVTGEKTLFRGISLVPSGSAWEFSNGSRPNRKRYFDCTKWEQQPHLSADEFYEKFTHTISQVVPRYARSNQTVGLSLTGGFDTRLIMAAVHGHCKKLPCYTFGGTWGETYDIGKARQLAQIENYSFDTIRLNKEFFKEFATLATRTVYIADGNHDVFGAHDLFFNQIARKIAPVRLTGKFGSEVVRVRKLIPTLSYDRHLLVPELTSMLHGLPPSRTVSHKGHDLSGVLFKEIPWYEFGRVALEQSQLTLRTPYMDNDLVKLMFQASYALRASGNMQGRYIKDTVPSLSAVLTNLGGLATKNKFLTRIIYLINRSWFKVEYIYLFAAPHWLTRIDRSLERFKLEERLSGKQKFEGYRIWIRTEIADFIQQTLLSPNARYGEFFNRKKVEAMVKGHVGGTHNYLNEINKVLTIELINTSLLNS